MKKHSSEQQGFVSIVACLIIMVILSLITIGFAQIMSREQRQALDRQLSTQAFYAAESGVNDARNAKFVGYSDSCSPAVAIEPTVPETKSTCVFVNLTPKTIKYDNVGASPKVFPVHTVNASGTSVVPATITVKWSKMNSNPAWTDFRAAGETGWPTQGSWQHNTGVGRLYLAPFKNNSSRDSLLTSASYFVLNPSVSGPSSQVLSTGQGSGMGTIVNGACADSSCTATITISGGPYDDFYLALSSLYQDSHFEISAVDVVGTQLGFKDVQVLVDSTGKTTDVLRRIEVMVPLIDDKKYPSGALVGEVCKLWTASPAPNGTSTTCL